MEAVQTIFVRFSHNLSRAAHAVGAKFSAASRAVASSRPVQAVVVKFRHVKANPTVQATVGKGSLLLRGLGRTYLVFVVFEAIIRVIFDPASVKLLWTDWRNNHRRLVSLLWSALMLTVVAYYFTIWFGYLFLKALYITGLAIVFSLLWNLAVQLYKGEAAGEANMRRHFTPARVSFKWLFRFTVIYPLRMLNYVPNWLNAFITRRTVVQTEDQSVDVFIERVVSYVKEQAQAAAREIVDTEQVVYESQEPTQEFHADAEEFASDPRAAGVRLAMRMISESGLESTKLYRQRKMAKDLREAGLTSTQVALALAGFDETVQASTASVV